MRVHDWKQIKVVGHIDKWSIRKYIIHELLDPNLETIIESGRSLGVIKPRNVLDFYAKPRNKLQDDAEKLVIQKMEEAENASPVTLFEYLEINDPYLLEDVRNPHAKIEQLPWICYKFYCANPECKGHNMMVIDWEAQELFRKYKTEKGPVKKKLFDWMTQERDLYFIVGNTWRFHKSFMIIGLFYPPKGIQPQPTFSLFSKKRLKQKTLFDFNKEKGDLHVFI